jgi:hypothetical protein
MISTQSKKILFVFTVSVILALKFIASYSTGLFEDEAIYWNWSQTVDASYSLTTIAFIRLFTSVFNSSEELIVRLPALLSNIFIILFIVKTGALLNARKDMIYITVITFLSIPFVTIYSSYISPDTFLLTFTLISLYYLLRSVKYGNISDFVLAGLFTGSMILSKYTAVLFLAASVISILTINKKLSKNVIVYLLTALTVSLPLIIWNLINEPVWFKYYLLTGADKVNTGLIETITTFGFSQASILMPFGLLLILFLIISIFKNRSSHSEVRFLKYLTIFLMIIFVMFSFSGKIKGNWFFIIYLPVLLFLLTMTINRFSKSVITCVVVFNFGLLTVMNLPADKIEAFSKTEAAHWIDNSYSYYWPDHKSNVNNDNNWSERIIKMKKWKEVVNSIEANIIESDTKYDFIACDDFTLCPLLEYYFDEKREVYLVGDLRFKYINSAESFDDLKGKDAILVTYKNSGNEQLQNKFIQLTNINDVKYKVSDNLSKEFKIILGENFLPQYTSNIPE